MNLIFKNKGQLNNRKIDSLKENEIDNQNLNQNINNQYELCLFDLTNHLQNNDTQNDIYTDLKTINKAIKLKYIFAQESLFHQLPQNLLALLNHDSYIYDFRMIGLVYKCIANLLDFDDFRLFFIQNDIIQNSLNLISHEDNAVCKESLHIISKLMEFIINNNIPVDENFIDYVCLNTKVSDKHTEYSLLIFLSIAKYSSSKSILKPAIPLIFKLFHYYTKNEQIISLRMNKKSYNSDIDALYDDKYDLIKKYIVQTIYYILKSDFNFYFTYKTQFPFLFYSINGFSTTKTSPELIRVILKILLLIIYNDEREGHYMVSFIGNYGYTKNISQIDFNYDIYLFFLQNSTLTILQPLIQIMIFNLFHLPNSFYEYCSSPSFIKHLINWFIDESSFILKSITIKFLSILAQHPNAQKTIETLLDNDFILTASFFLEYGEPEPTLNYLIIINIMIQYAVRVQNGYDDVIASSISDTPEIRENIDTIINDIGLELNEPNNPPNSSNDQEKESMLNQKHKIFDLCNQIKCFCRQVKDANAFGQNND